MDTRHICNKKFRAPQQIPAAQIHVLAILSAIDESAQTNFYSSLHRRKKPTRQIK